jgi:hypothetical protein
VQEILADGAGTARRMAAGTVREVRERMGLLPAGAGGVTSRPDRGLES